MQWGEEHSMLSNFLQRDLEEFVERIRETLLLVSGQSVRVPHVVQFLETRYTYTYRAEGRGIGRSIAKQE